MSIIFGKVETSLHESLRVRFIAAILVPAILLSLSISFGMFNLYQQYLFTQKEISGTKLVHHLFEAVIELQKVRGYSRDFPWNNETGRIKHRQEAMKSFNKSLNSMEYKELNYRFNIEKDVSDILYVSQHIYSLQNTSEDELFDKYTSVIEKTNRLILIVADRSNLILDPKIDTYYLMEMSVKKIPDLCELLMQIRSLGVDLLLQEKSEEVKEEAFKAKVFVLLDYLKKFERTKQIVKESIHEIEPSFKKQEAVLDKALTSFVQICALTGKGSCSDSAQEFYTQGSSAVASLSATFRMTMQMLESRLNKRVDDLYIYLILTLLASIIALTSIFFFSFSFYRLQRRAYLELERISITDPLTGIPNRRYLNIVFENEIQRARREKKSMAFGILDIDFFKQYNDTYGHHEGDVALQKVAQAIKDSLHRAEDFYFRFGGEEFCFLFRSESLIDTQELGEKIRSNIEALEIEHKKNSSSKFVTVSIGLIHISQLRYEDLDKFIKFSDDLLYEAKDSGRNRCITRSIN